MTRLRARGVDLALWGPISCGVAGAAAFNLAPLYLDGMRRRLGLDDAQTGWLMGAEIAGIALAAMLALAACRQWDPVRLARAGLVMIVAGNLVSLLVTGFASLLGVRFLVGLFGDGIVYAAAIMLLGTRPSRVRAFATLSLTNMAVTAAVLWGLPRMPLDEPGIGPIATFVFFALLALLAVRRLDTVAPTFAGSGVGLSGPARHLRWIQLIALFGLAAYAVNLGAVWPFAERLAEGAGVAGPAIPQLLVVSVLFQAMGSVTALVLGRNGRHGRVLLFVMLMQLASQALIWQADGSASLLIGLSLWGASWNLGIAFLLATIAGMPNGSRGLAFVPGVEALGVSLGPMFVAMALSGHLQDTVPMVATTAMLFALAVFLSIDRRRRGD
ncbi:MAG: hypothetical protein KDI88_08790 [Gammaproteobacteria bacterium]|nr:hypothetical protein [Gammaproteobacteria bacterium]